MFPKMGKSFQGPGAIAPYATLISQALRSSLHDSHRAVKTVMAWTGANERTAKNWLAGSNGPQGDHLMLLLSKSDTVLMALIRALPLERQARLMTELMQRADIDMAIDSVAWQFFHSVRAQTRQLVLPQPSESAV